MYNFGVLLQLTAGHHISQLYRLRLILHILHLRSLTSQGLTRAAVSGHSYIQNSEDREEAGTPDIVGCIRAGKRLTAHGPFRDAPLTLAKHIASQTVRFWIGAISQTVFVKACRDQSCNMPTKSVHRPGLPPTHIAAREALRGNVKCRQKEFKSLEWCAVHLV